MSQKASTVASTFDVSMFEAYHLSPVSERIQKQQDTKKQRVVKENDKHVIRHVVITLPNINANINQETQLRTEHGSEKGIKAITENGIAKETWKLRERKKPKRIANVATCEVIEIGTHGVASLQIKPSVSDDSEHVRLPTINDNIKTETSHKKDSTIYNYLQRYKAIQALHEIYSKTDLTTSGQKESKKGNSTYSGDLPVIIKNGTNSDDKSQLPNLSSTLLNESIPREALIRTESRDGVTLDQDFKEAITLYRKALQKSEGLEPGRVKSRCPNMSYDRVVRPTKKERGKESKSADAVSSLSSTSRKMFIESDYDQFSHKKRRKRATPQAFVSSQYEESKAKKYINVKIG